MNKSLLTLDNAPSLFDEKIIFHVPKEYRRGKLGGDERKSIESAVNNIKRIATLTELNDWSNLNILDYGCGVKFTQALLQHNIKVQNYVGMDVFKEMIQYLNGNVKRQNFHYYSVPFRNERYNKSGTEFFSNIGLPGNFKTYDLIILQSVFTHFNPNDFLTLLHVLKKYTTKDTRMVFTCFIDNNMEHDYLDTVPDKPLLKAFYKESFIRSMLEESNWKVISLNPPSFQMAYQFTCEPY